VHAAKRLSATRTAQPKFLAQRGIGVWSSLSTWAIGSTFAVSSSFSFFDVIPEFSSICARYISSFRLAQIEISQLRHPQHTSSRLIFKSDFLYFRRSNSGKF